MAKLTKKESKTFMTRVNTLATFEEETGLISLFSDIENNKLNVDLGRVVINTKKETVVLITPEDEKIIARPTKVGKKDKFDDRTGMGIVILKALTGLTNSRYETKKYQEATGVTYEELALELLTAIGVTKEVFDSEYKEDSETYSFNVAIIGNLDTCDCDYDCDNYDDYETEEDLESESEEDYLEKKYETVKKLVDTAADITGAKADSYAVKVGNYLGMPGICVYGEDENMGELLKEMIHRFIV